jgi:polygalacturonase
MFNIQDFGAAPNIEVLQTNAIQAAIDACHNTGGGIVTVPPGSYHISTIYLRSNVSLHLENDAVLVGSHNLTDYPEISDLFIDAVGHVRGKCLIYGRDLINSSITGNGTIDGNGSAFKIDESNRPLLVRYVNCHNISLSDIYLRNSAAWVVHLFRSENIQIHRVTINSHVNSNNDGVDIDSCKSVQISNCSIDTSDDAICIKSTDSNICEDIKVTHCNLKSIWGALKIGTETFGDIRNITFSNITIRDTFGGGLKIISMDGSRVENIIVDTITMENVSGPIFLRLGSRLRTYYKNQVARKPGTLKNITISNIDIHVIEEGYLLYGKYPRKAGIIATGIPGHLIENLNFNNLNIIFPGDTNFKIPISYNVPEQEAEYPEFPMFHPLPSWGFFFRHINEITLRHITLKTENTDARPPIFVDDVKNINISDTTINNLPIDNHSQLVINQSPLSKPL